jgi:hypothetical protein
MEKRHRTKEKCIMRAIEEKELAQKAESLRE